MKKSFVYFLLSLPLWSFMACTDNITVDVAGGTTQLSVDGELTDQPGPYTIKLAETVSAFGSTTPPPVTNATVTLTDDTGAGETLRETTPGVYQTQTLRGQVGRSYTLRIETARFGAYTAQTQLRRPTPIDSVYSEQRALAPGQPSDGYIVRYDYTDPPGVGDNFRARLYRTRGDGPTTLMNRPLDLQFVQDIFNDGKRITNVIAGPVSFEAGDRVTLELASITDDGFQFLRELQAQTNNGGLFANPPANVRTNIVPVAGNAQRAVGYFFGSALTRKTIVIRP